MVSFRTMFAAVAATVVPAQAALTSQQLIIQLNLAGQYASSLSVPAQALSITNAPLAAFGQGPWSQVSTGLAQISGTLNQTLANFSGTPMFPNGTDSDAIYQAALQTLSYHTSLLNILILKAAGNALSTVAYAGPPIATNLRNLGSSLDATALALISGTSGHRGDLSTAFSNAGQTVGKAVTFYNNLAAIPTVPQTLPGLTVPGTSLTGTTVPIPGTSISGITISGTTLPTLTLPNTPSVGTPSINTPSINTPSINTPSLSTTTIRTPSVSVPGVVTPTIPTTFSISTVSVPSVTTPSVPAPSLRTTQLGTPLSQPAIPTVTLSGNGQAGAAVVVNGATFTIPAVPTSCKPQLVFACA